MDDKDFPTLFTKLGYRDVAVVKDAAAGIVSKVGACGSEYERGSIKEKYANGDLGKQVGPDLNYTLKRLVKGMNSENHAVKQGFFLTLVLMLKQSSGKVDLGKLVGYIISESRCTAAMKASETNANWMGRFLSLSAIVESGMLAKASQEGIVKVIDELAVVYKEQDFLREGIQVALGKILAADSQHVTYMAEKFFAIEVPGLKSSDDKFLLALCNSASAMALYLRLKKFAGKKGVFSGKIVNDIEMLGRINQTIKGTLYSFPRLHASIGLLVEQAFNDFEGIKNVFNIVCCKFCFDEDILQAMKSGSRFKLMNVGFALIDSMLQSVKANQSLTIKCLMHMLQESIFLKALLRNISQQSKNATQESARKLKETIIELLEGLDKSSKDSQCLCYELLMSLFGPNSLTHFSVKKNYDLVLPLTQALTPDQIATYLEFLQEQFDEPSVSRYFSDGAESTENSRSQIRHFVLNIAANLPQLFHKSKDNLNNRHIMLAANLVARAAFSRSFKEEESRDAALSKFYVLLQHLVKFSAGGMRRGFCKEGELWIMRMNKLLSKMLLSEAEEQSGDVEDGELDLASLCKQHKAALKFAEKEFQQLRLSFDERNQKQANQVLAIESLYLSLCTLVLVPGAKPQVIANSLEDLEELKQCFLNLGLQKDQSKKKKKNEDDGELKQARQVLVDLLISLLTRPQAYLRDQANFVFRAFCTDCLDDDTLQSMFNIICSRNEEAGQYLQGDEEAQEDDDADDEEGEVEMLEGAEDSDESSSDLLD